MIPTTVSSADAAGINKLRILCLHGYLQNADVFKSRIGSMRKGLKRRAEFTFIDAPYLIQDASEISASESAGTAIGGRSWWLWDDIGPESRPSRAATYSGWAASHQIIEDAIIKNWPIDILLGFSQGATATALFLAEATKRKSIHTPPKAILIGGFLPRDEQYTKIITSSAPIHLHSLHISGENDNLVPPERSEQLWNIFEKEKRRVWIHQGKHMVPTCTGEFKKVVAEFLDTNMNDISGIHRD